MANEKISEVMQLLEDGVQAVFTSEKYLEYLKFTSKFHNYSFNNTLLIMLQNPNASYVAGFNDWKKKHNRFVKKGEKGLRIIAPVPYKMNIEVPVYDDNHNPVVIDGKPLTEQKTIQKLNFKVVSVFDISQTDGEPIPELTTELKANVENYADLFAAIQAYSEYPIEFEDITDGAKGKCNFLNKKIIINNGMSESQNIKTALHEVAHSKLHEPNFNDIDDDKFKIARRTKEVQAESVAFIVANHFGIDTSDYSFDYIASWSENKELSDLKESLDIIQKEANNMIQGIQEQYDLIIKSKTVEQVVDSPEQGVDRDVDGISDNLDSSFTDNLMERQFALNEINSERKDDVTKQSSNEEWQYPQTDTHYFQNVVKRDLIDIKRNIDLAKNESEETYYKNRYSTQLKTYAEVLNTTSEILEKLINDTEINDKIPMPDNTVTQAEMFEYGYTSPTMLPISQSQADLLYEAVDNLPVYKLYHNNTEALVENYSDLNDDTIMYGLESEDWNKVCQEQFISPHVKVIFSESPNIKDNQLLTINEADSLFYNCDLAATSTYEDGHYDKTKFALLYIENGRAKVEFDRQDFGDGDGSLTQHISMYDTNLASFLECHAHINKLMSLPEIDKNKINNIRQELNSIEVFDTTTTDFLNGMADIYDKLMVETKSAQSLSLNDNIDTSPLTPDDETIRDIKSLVSAHKEKIKNLPNEHNTIVVNAFAGPGAGKTTSCLEITEKLKKQGFVAEYVQEYAKELVWDNKFDLLDGSIPRQFDILKEQLNRVDRLYGKVDFIVTDSPVLLNATYLQQANADYVKAIQEIYSHFNNFNYFVERDVTAFEKEGRIHNLEQSLQIDTQLKNTLEVLNLDYGVYNHSTIDNIVTDVIKYRSEKPVFLDKDLIRQANAASLTDMGDIINRSFLKHIDVINGFNLPAEAKEEAVQHITSMYNEQLSLQIGAVNPYVSGVARPVNGTQKKAALVSKKQEDINTYIANLQRQSEKNNISDKQNLIATTLREAEKNGNKKVTIDGVTYYKGRKNWSTTPPKRQQKYSKEENDRITAEIKSSIPIQDYAHQIGFTVQKVGSYYTLKEHDSVRIDPRKNRFVQNSTGINGSIIDFVMHFENLDKAAAIDKLAKHINTTPLPSAQIVSAVTARTADKPLEPLVLPEKAKTMKNIFAYLINTRKIDSQIVSQWVKNGNLYQDTHNNCVFVTYDKNGKANFASQRGTNTNKPFKADVIGSNYDTCHFINNNAPNLIIGEAVIDIMSVQTILKSKGRDLNNYNYLSTNGTTKTHAVINALKSSNTDKVILAMDNDEAGIKARNDLRALISDFDKNIQIIDFVPQNEKDWNAELVANVLKEEQKQNKGTSLSDKISECQHKADLQNQNHSPAQNLNKTKDKKTDLSDF